MNAQERKTLNRALISKDTWKTKAKARQKSIRLLQLKVRDLERSRTQWKEKFFQLKNNEEKSKISETSAVLGKKTKIDQKKN